MSGTCTEFVPKRKFADGHGTDGEQACSAGLSAKIDDNAAFGDMQHVTSGLEEGRAQHGHSSSAHSHTEVHAVDGKKWNCSQIQYVMRPSLDGTSSLYPLSSIWCECRGLAQRRWQPLK